MIQFVPCSSCQRHTAKVAHTGLPISSAVVIDANGGLVSGVPAAGANSVVIVDGSAVAFNVANTVVLQNGQFIAGVTVNAVGP